MFSVLETRNKIDKQNLEQRRIRKVSLLVVLRIGNGSPGLQNRGQRVTETEKAVDTGYSVKTLLSIVFECYAFDWGRRVEGEQQRSQY